MQKTTTSLCAHLTDTAAGLFSSTAGADTPRSDRCATGEGTRFSLRSQERIYPLIAYIAKNGMHAPRPAYFVRLLRNATVGIEFDVSAKASAQLRQVGTSDDLIMALMETKR